jgi:hypothetical protein
LRSDKAAGAEEGRIGKYGTGKIPGGQRAESKKENKTLFIPHF